MSLLEVDKLSQAYGGSRILREVAAASPPPKETPETVPELPDPGVRFHDATEEFQRRLIERAASASTQADVEQLTAGIEVPLR